MIQITAYLRTEEDLKKWKALPNKAEFLHNALNPPILKEGDKLIDVQFIIERDKPSKSEPFKSNFKKGKNV